MPPLGSGGGDPRGNGPPNVDAWGGHFPVWGRENSDPGAMSLGCRAVCVNPLAKGGGEAVGGSRHGGPVGMFISVFERVGPKGGDKPNKSASEIIASPLRWGTSTFEDEKGRLRGLLLSRSAGCGVFTLGYSGPRPLRDQSPIGDLDGRGRICSKYAIVAGARGCPPVADSRQRVELSGGALRDFRRSRSGHAEPPPPRIKTPEAGELRAQIL